MDKSISERLRNWFFFIGLGYGSSSKSDRIFVVPHRFAYWPSTDIPFEIDPSLKDLLLKSREESEAMKEIEIRTCITFIPVESLGKRHKSKTANLKPIVFNSSKTECSTYLTSSAREETRIFLNENCSQDYSFVAGNLVQALGFIPEHARSDRDQYIKILKPKILDSDSNDPLRNIVLSSGLHSNVTYSGENFYTPYDIYR
uniref:Metalloendopeptidase n=1 Tax=Romanomermis culicivorax TaxID=13658 RepID=A0A915JFN6_ROMCU